MRRTLAPIVALALLGASGCATSEPYHAEFENLRVGITLTAPAGTERAPVDDVWSGLWAGMAADAETQALIRRLYSGLPAALVGSADAESTDGIRLRVSDAGRPEVKAGVPATETPPPATITLSAVRDIDLQVNGPPGVTLRVEEPASQEPSQLDLASGWADAMFADVEVLRLAAAEYVLRKLGAPWALAGGVPLEQQLEAFCRRFTWSRDGDAGQ